MFCFRGLVGFSCLVGGVFCTDGILPRHNYRCLALSPFWMLCTVVWMLCTIRVVVWVFFPVSGGGGGPGTTGGGRDCFHVRRGMPRLEHSSSCVKSRGACRVPMPRGAVSVLLVTVLLVPTHL